MENTVFKATEWDMEAIIASLRFAGQPQDGGLWGVRGHSGLCRRLLVTRELNLLRELSLLRELKKFGEMT